MNKKNSVIGCGYIPRGVEAVCLKTKREAELGEVEYKIIAGPYEREWIVETTFPVSTGASRTEKRMAVNVLDANTGLMYAVEYEPANLVRPTSAPETDQPGEPVDFATRAGQIAEKLKVMFDPAEGGGGISDKCGVAFFAVSDNGDDKTSTCVAFLGGRGGRIVEAIASACSNDPQALEIVKHASIGAMFHRIFDGDNKKK